MGSFEEAWQVICDYFQNEKKITDVAYKTWISRIEPKNIDFEKGEITLLVPNDFHRQTLMRCYIPMLEDAYLAVFGTTFTTNFIVPDEIEKKEQTKFLSNEQSADAGYEFIMPPADMTRYGAVETRQEGWVYAEWLKQYEGQYDGVIMSLPNFSDENGAVAALENCGKPIFIQAYPDEIGCGC